MPVAAVAGLFWIDGLVVVIYLVCITLTGVWMGRRISGEEVLQPCTLPETTPAVDRPMLLTAGGLELPMPSRTSIIGFITVWLVVGGIIGAFVWIVS